MNIAILGGRFDPPHIGHYLIAQQTLEYKKDVDEVWLIPAGKHQWKPTVASGNDRLAMTKFLVSPKVKVSDIELRRSGISYTIDTIQVLKQKYNHKLYWIIGSDIISEFHRWGKRDLLTKEATFLVFPRDPYNIPKNLPQGFEVVTNKNLITTNLSSTIVRDRIKNHLPITNLVPQEVENYIKEQKLYL